MNFIAKIQPHDNFNQIMANLNPNYLFFATYPGYFLFIFWVGKLILACSPAQDNNSDHYLFVQQFIYTAQSVRADSLLFFSINLVIVIPNPKRM